MEVSEQRRRVKIIASDLLLAAYAAGYFPMADSKEGTIGWYSPDPRGIIPLDTFNISRSLRQVLKKKIFDIRWNTSFEEVIRSCGERKETWISEEIIQSYLELFKLGYAHSVEVWKEEKLVGGLYGVALGAAFFGESMFSIARDASKVGLVHLAQQLQKQKFELLDTQFITPHLAKFGAYEIPREKYLHQLKKAVRKQRQFLD